MRRVALAVAFCALAAGPARAFDRPIHVGLGGGMSVPVGDASDALKTGFHVQGFATLKPPGLPFGLRGALAYHHFGFKDLAAGEDGHATALSGLGSITMGIPLGPIRPYVALGVGACRLKGELAVSDTTSTNSQTKFALDGGLCVELKLGGIHGFAEAHVANVYTDQGFDASLTDKSSTRIIPVTFGLVF
jgi:hypothetical protein